MDLRALLGLGSDIDAEDENVISFEIHFSDEAASMDEQRGLCMRTAMPHLDGYIWQKDRQVAGLILF